MATVEDLASESTGGIFTAPSVESLLEQLARRLQELLAQFQQDEWFWLRTEDFQGPDREWTISEIKTKRMGTRNLAWERAPGLSALVRVAHNPSNSAQDSVALLVDFRQLPLASEAEWNDAQQAPTPGRFKALNTAIKASTLRFRIGELPEEGRLGAKWQKGLRRAHSWRFDPNKESPVVEAAQSLERKGDTHGAERLRRSIDGLRPEIQEQRARRESSEWRTWWVDPTQQTAEDLRFLLSLTALQEGIASGAADSIRAWARLYLSTRYGRYWDEGIVFEVLRGLERSFAEPEGWRALQSYIRVAGRRLSKHERPIPRHKSREGEGQDELDARLMDRILSTPPPGEEGRRWLPPRGRPSISGWSPPAAASEIGVHQATLYRWIETGAIPARRVAGRMRIDDRDLREARRLAARRPIRLELQKRLERAGKKKAAAKKWIQRQLKKGRTEEQLLRELLERRRGGTLRSRP